MDDKLLSVNGVNVENVEHSFVIRLLKEAKDFIHLVVKRKLPTAVTSHKHDVEIEMTNKHGHNVAIQQTAATVVANFTNNIHNDANDKENGKDLMAHMMQNGTTSMSSLKPFKVTLSKRDKKDTFGIVLGCKYYIKEILPDSVASNEANLRKGDILLKLNDLSHDQFSLFTARKILQKTKESKVHLVIKRNSVGSSLSSASDDDDSDLIIDETPIHVSVPSSLQHPTIPPPPPPPPPPPSSLSLQSKSAIKIPPEVPPRPSAPTSATTTPKKELKSNDGITEVDSSNNQPHPQAQSLFKQLFKPIKTNGQGGDPSADTNNRLSKFYSK